MIRWELMSLGLKIKTTCQVDSLGFQARVLADPKVHELWVSNDLSESKRIIPKKDTKIQTSPSQPGG